MTPKALAYWEDRFLDACGLAILYEVELNFLQFAASNCLEPGDADQILAYLQSHSICR
jgi:hypothetical protein